MEQPAKPKRPATSGSFRKGQSGNPAGRARTRRDGWENSATGHGTSRDRRTLTRYGVDIVTDLEALQLWRSEFIAERIIEWLPNEAFSPGWALNTDDKDAATAVMKLAADLGVDAAMVLAAEYERALGGGAIFPVLDGALGDLSKKLDEGAIAEVKALHVLEPRELQPMDYYTQLSDPKFGKPMTYRFQPLMSGRGGYLQQQTVHESRLVIFPGKRVTKQTQPGQREGWGDSRLSLVRTILADFGLGWGSAATLIHRFGQRVFKIKGLADVSAQESVDVKMASVDRYLSTIGALTIDSEDDFVQMTTSIAGIADVLIQLMNLMAAAADMTVTELFGVSPAGMNATGEHDSRSGQSRVNRVRNADYKPRLSQLLRLIMLSSAGPMGGTLPDTWTVDFKALWTPSEQEIATTRKTDADRAVALVGAGIVSPDDVASSFYGGDTYSSEIVIDWAAREKQKKLDEVKTAALDAASLAAMGRGSVPPVPGAPIPPADEVPALEAE